MPRGDSKSWGGQIAQTSVEPFELRGFRGSVLSGESDLRRKTTDEADPHVSATQEKKGKNVEWAGVQEFGPRLRLWTADGLRGGVGGPRQRGFGPGAGFLHLFLFKFKLLFVFNHFKSK